MPYIFEAILFLLPFGLYAIWLRLNPGQAVGTHVLALAVLGLVLSIGGAILYGLSRGMDPSAVYVPPRATVEGITPGHSERTDRPGAWPPGPGLNPPFPHEGPPRR